MAGYHRSKNWLIRTTEGLIPRSIARPDVLEQIERSAREEGRALDNNDLAQYFAAPYYIVKSWAVRGVLPHYTTSSGRARFLLKDVIELREKRERAIERLQKESEAMRTRERQRMQEILADNDEVRE